MKVLFSLLVLLSLAACEQRPSEEELEQQRQVEAARNQPTPKPGEWMFKGYKNPLEPQK